MDNFYEILLPGIPVSSTRGAFGWCTIVLIDQGGKKILFDTGSYNVRPLLLEQLGKRGLSPNDIDIVFISHVHFDHIVNAEVFGRSQILIPEADLNYAYEADDPFVPVTLIDLLKERLKTLAGEEYITDAVKAVSLPGHTPGHMGLFLENDNVIVAGDAVKNAWEFVHSAAPPPFVSEESSLQTYKKVKSLAKLVIPGHDRPFRLIDDRRVEYTQDWSAEIKIYGDPHGDVEVIQLP
jgi:glyoxylase-like metal-dependent hydrolase (beta-lactamase superfamily II)